MNVNIIYGTAWYAQSTESPGCSARLQGYRYWCVIKQFLSQFLQFHYAIACQPKHYREDLVGNALQTLASAHNIARSELFIQTKYTPIGGQDTRQPLPYDPSTALPDQIRTSFRKSLANLHTTYLDSYLLHSPLQTLARTLEAWRTLCALQDEGCVKAIGVSNVYDVGVLEALGGVRKVQVVQNRWYEGNGWDGAVWGYCKNNGIQYQSFWTLSGSPNLLAHPSLQGIASANGYTPAQVLFRLARKQGITPLSGTVNEQHMDEAVSTEHISLSESNLDVLKGLITE